MKNGLAQMVTVTPQTVLSTTVWEVSEKYRSKRRNTGWEGVRPQTLGR